MALTPVRSALANCSAGTLSEEEDASCRRSVLKNDGKEDYAGKSAEKRFTAAPGVPVADLNSEYVQATLKLREDILSYAKSDPTDPKTRVPLIKQLKQEGTDWVSKYARGGSARTQSARTMYIAVDAIMGHLGSNGYAPMPVPKLKVALANVDKATSFLAESR